MSKVKRKELQLPSYRIRTIMKSSPDVENISQDALYVVTKCTEMFIQYLAVKGLESSPSKILDYKGIATFTQVKPHLNFLTEILPQKLTVRQCKELMAKGEADSDGSSTEEDATFDERTSPKIENGRK